MILTDVIAVLQWWFVLFLLGLGFLPLTVRLFERFFDKGYIFSKILGLAITAYVIYFFGIIHLIPFNTVTVYLLFFLSAGVSIALLSDKWKILYHIKQAWRLFLFEEIMFLVALFVWAYIHSFAPDIHGLEKYMDYGFLNSILRGDFFPPKDMWLTPYFINYYYFGHFMTAVLTKLSFVPPNFAFNIMLSTIFAFCFTETFSIGAALYSFLQKDPKMPKIRRFVSGFLTACLVTLAGNLHIIYAFFSPYKNEEPLPIWQLIFSPTTFPNAYWYPNATRFIYHTIHEFPIYSWVVADLHGHVLDIPFVLFIIALLLSIFMAHDPEETREEEAPPSEKKGWRTSRSVVEFSKFADTFVVHPLHLAGIGFLLAIMYMTNAWDGAIYFLLTVLVIGFLHWNKRAEYKSFTKEEGVAVIKDASSSKKSAVSPTQEWILPLGRDLMLSIVITLVAFIVFALPYNINFKPFVSGIGVLCAPDSLTKIGHIGPLLFEKDHCQHSKWWEILTLYGFFFFFVASFIIFAAKSKKLKHTDYFILLLIILSLFLIIAPEFIYVKDIYPAHYRANTMFKLVFQAFMMLSICSSYIILRLMKPAQTVSGWPKPFTSVLYLPLTFILMALVMTYPFIAVKSYYNSLKDYKGLDGTLYLKTLYPSDYEAILWLNKKGPKGQPVILEAQGDSYTDYGRVSANTGLPTVLGWTVHEWLWRGSYDVPSGLPPKKAAEMRMYYPAPRIADVQNLYESTDVNYTRQLLKKYNVKYVFIGTLEAQKYKKLNQAKFGQLGKVIFRKGTTMIYEIKQ